MLTEYEQYTLQPQTSECQLDTSASHAAFSAYRDLDFSGQVISVDPEPADTYTLTVLSDGGAQPVCQQQQQQQQQQQLCHQVPHDDMCRPGDDGIPSWEQHGAYHVPYPEDDCAVTTSDAADSTSPDRPDRRCVKSLLHVALQKGGSFAQQYTSCGLPHSPLYSPLPALPHQYSVPQPQPQFVSSSSPSPEYCPVVAEEPMSTTGYCPSPGPGTVLGYGPCTPSAPYSPYRTTYPTPSPDAGAGYPPPYSAYQNTIVPLPVHMLPTIAAPSGPSPTSFPPPATPPTTPTSTSTTTKRKRNRGGQGAGGAPPRKRERSERQLHPCTLCDKRFKDNYSVNVHMRTHTGEKPFPCVVCGKMFRQKAHLAKHRSTHQAAEYALTAPSPNDLGVDANGNTSDIPTWATSIESKCKASTVWTPGVISQPLTTLP